MEKQGKKRLGVLVGCNYPNTPNELHGCINDVVAMRDMLVERFEFDTNHIQVLTDAPGSLLMPTGANIKKALDGMVDVAEPGDVLFFHYSGHGTRISSLKPTNPFRQDEAIVPCDFNLITDVDFRELVNRVPKGASFTILSDSCHSGGLIDKEKEQIGPSSVTTTNNTTLLLKTIPFESIIQHLASLTNINSNTSDIGTHFLEMFGGDASLRFRLPPPLLPHVQLIKASSDDEGILFSGCQANETSADMNPTMEGGKAYGAFSNAVQMVLHQHLSPLSNIRLVMLARKFLKEQGFEQQHPCLYCSDDNADATFLCHQQPQTSALSST